MKISAAWAFCSLIILVPGIAWASGMVSVGTINGQTTSYDSSSLAWSGKTVTTMVEATFATPQPLSSAANGPVAARAIEHMAFACGTGNYTDLGVTAFSPAGTVVYTRTTADGPKPAAAGTPAASLYAALCQ